ncbi:metallophosphoesterase [Burkholderiales bacterium GJ-E10]|nr:metallophosphoesterase [Burkholderiales bacterium GJ-E10]
MVHTADWQIGKRYGQFDADEAALLAEERFGAVARIADLAGREDADMVLVAGDVFDAQGVSDRTVFRLFQSMEGFHGPWVLIPGNHDASLAESVWTRAERLGAIPPHVHVCLRSEPLVLDGPAVAILPAPLTQRHTYTDCTDWFDAAVTPVGMPRIGIAHGSVQGILAPEIDSTNPIALDRAASARLDYLALGDWHGTRQIDPRTWYSGTPETDRFRNNDSGQALVVEIAHPGALPHVRPVATGRYRWRMLERELRVAGDLDALTREFEGLGPDDVVALAVRGQIDLAGRLALDRALGAARARTRSLIADLDALRLHPTPADIQALHAEGYLGDVIDALRAEEQTGDAERARDALALLAALLDEVRPPVGAAR